MKKFMFSLAVVAVIFSGCTRMYNSNEVSVGELDTVYTYKTGTVQSIKKVVIKDNGNGMVTGLMAGTVIGGMFGGGRGNMLSTLIGGLTGAYAGYEADKANGEELFIKLDNGRNIVTIVKGVKLQPGDKVRLIFNGNRIIRVEKI